MASKEFSNTLKDLRIKAGFTQKQVYEHFGIPQSTFSSWEVGKSEPSGEMLMKLCELYKCNNILETFSDSAKDVLFTNSEWELIEKYRLISRNSAGGKALIDSAINCLHGNIQILQEQKEQLAAQFTRIAELEVAQAKKEHAATLECIPLTKKSQLYTYLGKIACAGTGFYFDDIPTDIMEAPYMRGADFIVGVSGDSMEPDYHDGDKLYIRKADDLSRGDVGIFTVNGECFLKEYGKSGLISRNPDYDDIPGTEDVRLIGRVLGKVQD